MSHANPQYLVRYVLRNHPTRHPMSDDGPFDLRRDALDHRNWFFGHSPDVVACWVEKDGVPTGARLVRE